MLAKVRLATAPAIRTLFIKNNGGLATKGRECKVENTTFKIEDMEMRVFRMIHNAASGNGDNFH